ncbi:MAG: type II toxin-antitoxin system VapC family toxin [Planctomycetes bacterium]|nr:type II toxin-antitoxin system VapC family toxin [Planctomycetota bacterium]
MIYHLDASACVEHLRRPESPVHKWLRAVDADTIRICSVVRAELWRGVEKWPAERNRIAVSTLLATFDTVPFDDEAARVYAKIRDNLERKGRIIGPYDLQIAAVALSRGATLVTGNENEFQRVQGLKCFPLTDLAAGKTPP